jgi:hypothetical protein
VNLRTPTKTSSASIVAMPEREFEYFPSPENEDDNEQIAYQFLYCSSAVDEWPRFRWELEESGAKTSKQCDDLETNAINIFREVRDAILAAIGSDDPAVMPQARLLDRLVHAHAFVALHANPASLLEYRRMICPQIDSLPRSRQPDQGDFNKALWEGKWNASGDHMPAEITGEEAIRSRLSHEMDGLHNNYGRLDPAATGFVVLDELFPAPESLPPLSTVHLAFVRAKLRSIGTRAGLTKSHADFMVRMALDGAKQADDPTAWRAIRDRKRGPLLANVQNLLNSLR